MPLPAFDGGGLGGTGAGAGAAAGAGDAAPCASPDEPDGLDEPDDGATTAVAPPDADADADADAACCRSGVRRLELASCCGLLCELGLSLTFEFALHCDVGQPLPFDLGQFDNLGFGGGLEVFVLLAGLGGGFALAFEVGSLGPDVLHHRVEVVEFDRGGAAGDRRLAIGGDAGVGLVEVDQQWDRRAGVDEAALGVLLEARAHRVGLRLDSGEFLLGGDDLDFERVESRLGIEHRLRCGVGSIACGLDLLGCPNCRGILRIGHGERHGAGTHGHGEHHRNGRERPPNSTRRQPGHPRHDRRA